MGGADPPHGRSVGHATFSVAAAHNGGEKAGRCVKLCDFHRFLPVKKPVAVCMLVTFTSHPRRSATVLRCSHGPSR